ncbi:ABC transporter ATP-binding protein [Pseudomonas aeruginosa]|nr:ABC transporter ATP-binding protein [Pseudomonas aeruginosa]
MLQAKLFARLSKDIVYRIRLRLIERLRHIALGEYETLGGGSISAHLVTDLDTLDKFVGETLSRFLVALLTLLGTAAILVWMHWQLALLILLFNPLVIWSTVQLGKRVKHLKKLENDSTARFTQALTETLEAIQEVRAGNRQGYFLGRLGHRAQEVRDYAVASQWKSDAAGRASGLLFQFGIDVFRAAAMLTVLLSDLSIGQMLAVFSYLWFVIGPVEQLLGLQYAYYAAGGALQRINELLARADEPRYPPLRDPFAGRTTVGIEVRGLDFAYGEDKVLEQLDLNIGAGEKVALVGASGGGKSTLVQLLLGLYSAQRGSIRYGGVPLEEIGLDCVREHVAVVLQHPALFNDSVRANLTMGRERSDQACWRALQIAQLAATACGACRRGWTPWSGVRGAPVGRSAAAPGDRPDDPRRAQGGDPRRGHLGPRRRYRVCPAPGARGLPRRPHHIDRGPSAVGGEAGRPGPGLRWRAYRRRRRSPATDRRRRPLRPALRTSATDVRRQAVAWRFFSYIPI